ncbi:hypothetical protein [Pedobacter gandavensis]|uniref:hypothetical protein n=1 Tax=Pedobacter gandavensis TaxID=2679963 RepID=UPI00292EB97F|nr:hypothetical protein [Pedobacter gandavensis]
MKKWYVYKGTGDYFDSNNYRKLHKHSSISCVNGGKICAVLLKDKASIPSNSFSNKLMKHMVDAIASGLPQPCDQPQVLMKNS